MAEEDKQEVSEFENEAAQGQDGIVGEFLDFLQNNKKWWLTPIILVILLLGGLLIFATASGAAPFIYTLF